MEGNVFLEILRQKRIEEGRKKNLPIGQRVFLATFFPEFFPGWGLALFLGCRT
jgi:hypothetical protein